MLTFSIMGWIVLFLFAVIAVFLIYQVFKKDENDELLGGFNADDIEYGSFLDVDSFFLYKNNIRQDATIQVSLPLPTTPEDCIRAEIDHLAFFDIPYSVIDNVHAYEESTRAYKEKKNHGYNTISLYEYSDITYSKPVDSPEASDGIALGLFTGQLSSEPDQYSVVPEETQQPDSLFGNGGEFAGGGASGSWNTSSSDSVSFDSTPNND